MVAYGTASANRRPRIALIAYACEPNSESEPGVGWNFVRGLAEWAEVWVFTRANNRSVIEEEVRGGALANVHWEFVDLPEPFLKLKKRMIFGIQAYYGMWQWAVWRRIRRLCVTTRFAAAHHLTFGVAWLAPPAAFLPAPFIWGPVGGADVMAPRFLLRERLRSQVQELAYWLASWVVPRLSPLAFAARRRVRAVIFRSKSVARSFPDTPRASRHVIVETASAYPAVPRNRSGPFSVICVGRLQYWKGFRYALLGFYRFLKRGGEGDLYILGDGPEMQTLLSLHEENGKSENVHLMGRVSHDRVREMLGSATVQVHPSFRDGGSWAVIEALSEGLPVICLNASGVGDMVDETCGVPVDPESPEQVVRQIGDALLELSRNPSRVARLSRGAISRVETKYRWETRHREIRRVYDSLLQEC